MTRARDTALPPYVERSHYVTTESLNRGRSLITLRPVYTIVEYLVY
jgi:hypothetical protein